MLRPLRALRLLRPGPPRSYRRGRSPARPTVAVRHGGRLRHDLGGRPARARGRGHVRRGAPSAGRQHQELCGGPSPPSPPSATAITTPRPEPAAWLCCRPCTPGWTPGSYQLRAKASPTRSARAAPRISLAGTGEAGRGAAAAAPRRLFHPDPGGRTAQPAVAAAGDGVCAVPALVGCPTGAAVQLASGRPVAHADSCGRADRDCGAGAASGDQFRRAVPPAGRARWRPARRRVHARDRQPGRHPGHHRLDDLPRRLHRHQSARRRPTPMRSSASRSSPTAIPTPTRAATRRIT